MAHLIGHKPHGHVADGRAGNDGEARGPESVEGVCGSLLIIAHPDIHHAQHGLAPTRSQQIAGALRLHLQQRAI